MDDTDFDAPWTVDLEGRDKGDDIEVVTAQGMHVAQVPASWPCDQSRTPAEQDADAVELATLIAAAPCLLAACERAARWLRDMGNPIEIGAGEGGEEVWDVLSTLQAALEKAKGA